MMFEKLDIVLPDLDVHRLQNNSLNQPALNFKEYTIKDVQYCQSLFKPNLNFDLINITVIESGGAKVPHTDVWSVALNYYIHAEQETTIFYDNPSNHRIAVDGVPGLVMYEMEKLTPVASFCANTGDCYLLNTHIPHIVTDKYMNSRTILRLIWNSASYESVLDKIRRCYEW